jgi:hypothetical protein
MRIDRDSESKQRRQDITGKMRQGQATPTIPFALEEGGEMLEALRASIRELSPSDHQLFRNGLTRFQAALADRIEDMETIEDNWYKIAAPIIGIVIGGSTELSSGATGLTVAGMLSGLAAESLFSRFDKRRKQELLGRLARCRDLIDETERTG